MDTCSIHKSLMKSLMGSLYYPSTLEEEAGRSLQAGLKGQFQDSHDSYTEKACRKKRERCPSAYNKEEMTKVHHIS